MRIPRTTLMRQMKPGDSMLVAHGPSQTGDVLATSIASKIGGKWHTRKVGLIEGDRIIRAVILTCIEPCTPFIPKKRGRPRKTPSGEQT